MPVIRYTAPAKADLLDIADYLISEAGNEIAALVITRIRRKTKLLQRDAHRYQERPVAGIACRAVLIGT